MGVQGGSGLDRVLRRHRAAVGYPGVARTNRRKDAGIRRVCLRPAGRGGVARHLQVP
jgi:hypothetical protein